MDEQRHDVQLGPAYNSCVNTGYSLEDLLEAIDDREGWRERVRNIRADGATS